MKFLTTIFTFIPFIQAADIIVMPSESIQAAVDMALPGDTVIVKPGEYQNDNALSLYGVHITKNNIKLIGESTDTDKVILKFLPSSSQVVGILASPLLCEYNTPFGSGNCLPESCTADITVSGISVEEFPLYGIQTRCVDGFEISDCTTVNNLRNGIYPTSSSNGLIQDNESYGSKDSAILIGSCDNVTIANNDVHDSTYGIQIVVSNQIVAQSNVIYNNTGGVALIHPNGDSNPLLPVMADWVIDSNNIFDNNKLNDAPSGSDSQPPGIGVFVYGVSNNTVRNNTIVDNGTAGIAVVGYCTGLELTDPDNGCDSGTVVLKADPSADNNLISDNTFENNGKDQAPLVSDEGIPGVDILYIQSPSLNETGDGNCFELKIPTKVFAIEDGAPAGLFGQQLPNGCDNNSPFTNILNRFITIPKILFSIIFG